MEVRERLQQIKRKISIAATRTGRDEKKIKLIAVTKRVDILRIQKVIAEGITDLGENRVQELSEKINLLPTGLHWHMIGHLQTNKVKSIVGRVSLIHSLDSWRLAQEIDSQAEKKDVKALVLVQVNISGETAKYGLAPNELGDFLVALRGLSCVETAGLMTVAPHVRNPEEVRPFFKALRLLAEKHRLTHLSMGMSNDFEVAVEEGASILRLGTAIFGAREN